MADCRDGLHLQLPLPRQLVEPITTHRPTRTIREVFSRNPIYVSVKDFTTRMPPRSGDHHQGHLKDVREQLKRDLGPHLQTIDERIRTALQHREDPLPPGLTALDYRTVIVDILLQGPVQDQELVLKPNGWLLCRPEVLKIVKRESKTVHVPPERRLGDKVEVSRRGPLWARGGGRSPGVVPIKLHLRDEESFKLPMPGNYRFILNLEDISKRHTSIPSVGSQPENPSQCGRICSMTILEGEKPPIHMFCRLGGVLLLREKDGANRYVGITAAHSLADPILDATMDRLPRPAKEASQRRGIPSRSRTLSWKHAAGLDKVLKTPKITTQQRTRSRIGNEFLKVGVSRQRELDDILTSENAIGTVTPEDLDKVEWKQISGLYKVNWLGQVWDPMERHPHQISVGNLEPFTSDADFTLFDIPFDDPNLAGHREVTGWVHDRDLSFEPMGMQVLLGDMTLKATLLAETACLFVRGRLFNTRTIHLEKHLGKN